MISTLVRNIFFQASQQGTLTTLQSSHSEQDYDIIKDPEKITDEGPISLYSIHLTEKSSPKDDG